MVTTYGTVRDVRVYGYATRRSRASPCDEHAPSTAPGARPRRDAAVAAPFHRPHIRRRPAHSGAAKGTSSSGEPATRTLARSRKRHRKRRSTQRPTRQRPEFPVVLAYSGTVGALGPGRARAHTGAASPALACPPQRRRRGVRRAHSTCVETGRERSGLSATQTARGCERRAHHSPATTRSNPSGERVHAEGSASHLVHRPGCAHARCHCATRNGDARSFGVPAAQAAQGREYRRRPSSVTLRSTPKWGARARGGWQR